MDNRQPGVIVTHNLAEPLRRRLHDLAPQVSLVVVDREGRPVDDADLRQATVLLRDGLSAAGYERVLSTATELRWIHSASAGVEHLLDRRLQQRGICLTNSAGVYAVPIAEWVMFALLMIVKHGPTLVQMQRERRWSGAPPSDELAGKTLTIFGAGGIGREIARRAAAFAMRVWAINRSGRPVPHAERVISGADWREALRTTDLLVIAAPLTAATQGAIGARELALLPAHAWLINVARGAIVDEAALIAALQQGRLGGAALDVFREEPLPPDSPFWTLPNVIISPHHSGSSPRSTERMLDLFVENLRHWLAGEPLRNLVDFDAGY